MWGHPIIAYKTKHILQVCSWKIKNFEVEVILHVGSYPPNDHSSKFQNTPVAQD